MAPPLVLLVGRAPESNSHLSLGNFSLVSLFVSLKQLHDDLELSWKMKEEMFWQIITKNVLLSFSGFTLTSHHSVLLCSGLDVDSGKAKLLLLQSLENIVRNNPLKS